MTVKKCPRCKKEKLMYAKGLCHPCYQYVKDYNKSKKAKLRARRYQIAHKDEIREYMRPYMREFMRKKLNIDRKTWRVQRNGDKKIRNKRTVSVL